MSVCSLGWVVATLLWGLGAVQLGLVLDAMYPMSRGDMVRDAVLWPVWIVTVTVVHLWNLDSEGER